jgi:hypothetical protein
MGAPLDAIDTLELAELLDFTADALSWREAHIVHPDLQAHLRRWARRLGPDTREWNWASPAPPAPGERAASAVPGPDTDSPDRPGEPDELDDRRCQLSLPPGGIDQPKPPSCHDAVTMICPVDQRPFTPIGRQKYCRDACRAAAYRRRRDASRAPVVVPKTQPRRPITVYECDSCGDRSLGEQRCETCSTFMRRVGVGGCCPACEEPIAVTELLEGTQS